MSRLQDFPAGIAGRSGESRPSPIGSRGGKVQRLWERDAIAVDRRTKASGWAGSTSSKISSRSTTNCRSSRRKCKQRGFKRHAAARHGRIEPVPGSSAHDLRPDHGFPHLHVLDSTDPAQVKAFEHQIDLANTLFIVSSKSGSTLEPNIFKQYFFERTKQAVGADKVGSHFIAITDPGSKMQQVAEARSLPAHLLRRPSIGGRYSALSDFGMVPGAVMGMDTQEFLDRAEEMVEACGAGVPVEENPGVMLGMILGTAANAGRDKVTIIASPGISDLGAWLEQLLAESTGKIGKGIIPVDREPLTAPEIYGNDRVFAYVRLETGADADQDAKIAAIEKAGHPVVRIALPDIYDLGAGILPLGDRDGGRGLDHRHQRLQSAGCRSQQNRDHEADLGIREDRSLPAEKPILEDNGVKLFTDRQERCRTGKAAASDKSLAGYLKAHLSRIQCGRLLRAARLRRDERRARAESAGIAACGARQEARGDLPRLRAALSALDRTGLQRRPELRSVPADHLRRFGRTAGARSRNTRSGW